jgi:hypothetical protein
MGWKSNIQVRDLPEAQKVEVTCRKCGYVYYIDKSFVCRTIRDGEQMFLDEIEQRVRCRSRGCGGAVRLALSRLGELSGFVGGMP